MLDKDTKGVPGTPPIVETIFNKIDLCSVFVPDLTFVAKTDKGRQVPNPNVLIEYGWALKANGYGRIVPVMNESFGAPTETSLPFNMKHLRWPISYNLPVDGSVQAAEVRKGLVSALAAAIGEILRDPSTRSQPGFEAMPSTYDEAVFSAEREPLASRVGRISETNEWLYVPARGAKLFLRIIPTRSRETIPSKQSQDMLIQSKMEPLSLANIRGAVWNDMNKYGVLAYRTSASRERFIKHSTQLMKTSELWGISCELWTEDYRAREGGVLASRQEGGKTFIPSSYEDAFVRALENYVTFARDYLGVNLPLQLIAGITGLDGFRIHAPPGKVFADYSSLSRRSAHDQKIIFECDIRDWTIPPKKLLKPFFGRVWDAFGLERSDIIDVTTDG